jgi:hypothetical protein
MSSKFKVRLPHSRLTGGVCWSCRPDRRTSPCGSSTICSWRRMRKRKVTLSYIQPISTLSSTLIHSSADVHVLCPISIYTYFVLDFQVVRFILPPIKLFSGTESATYHSSHSHVRLILPPISRYCPLSFFPQFPGTAPYHSSHSHAAAVSFLEELENEESDTALNFGARSGGLTKLVLAREAMYLRGEPEPKETAVQEYFRRARIGAEKRRAVGACGNLPNVIL